MKGVILCGGIGKRLWPLTEEFPKSLLEVCGKPILEVIGERLKRIGINEVVLVINPSKRSMFNGILEKLGFEVRYAPQELPLGTGDALKRAMKFLDGEFLLINGDIIVSEGDLSEVVKADGNCILVRELEKWENKEEFGVVSIKDCEKLEKIYEKDEGRAIDSKLINAGVYKLESNISELLNDLRPSSRGELEITSIINSLEEVKVVFSREYCIDIGRPWDLLRANEILLKEMRGEIKGEISEKAEVIGDVYLGKDSKIHGFSTIIGPAYIGDGCEIGPNALIRPYTSIGNGCKVGFSVEVKNSVVMEGSKIAHLSYIGDSIIGKSCNIGAGTITANLRHDNEQVKSLINGKLVSTGRRKFGAVIGHGSKTGIGTLIYPGRKIGCNSWTSVGEVVREDIGSNRGFKNG